MNSVPYKIVFFFPNRDCRQLPIRVEMTNLNTNRSLVIASVTRKEREIIQLIHQRHGRLVDPKAMEPVSHWFALRAIPNTHVDSELSDAAWSVSQ